MMTVNHNDKMEPNISILVGSGFSIPAGLPSVQQLNDRLSNINENEILIATDETAFFLNGQENKNPCSGKYERIFLQEFLEFYNTTVLENTRKFHYETFFDYFSGYWKKDENKKVIEDFYEGFKCNYPNERVNGSICKNAIKDFNKYYSQLLASQFVKKIDIINYKLFVDFLKELLKTNNIKVHSLNHDLLIEEIVKKDLELRQNFADGYQLENSPYYEYNSHQQLEQFVDKFDKPLSLFKLHGSIDNTIDMRNYIHIKSNKLNSIMKKVLDTKTGKSNFEYVPLDIVPDFLSGTTNKMEYYNNSHYKKLFTHFQDNLSSSDILIVIGYGFHDKGINHNLEKYFLSRGKHMIVIDPKKPVTDLLEKYKAKYIQKSITQVTCQEYLG